MRKLLEKLEAAFAAAAFAEEGEVETAREIAAGPDAVRAPDAAPRPTVAPAPARPLRPVALPRRRKVSRLP